MLLSGKANPDNSSSKKSRKRSSRLKPYFSPGKQAFEFSGKNYVGMNRVRSQKTKVREGNIKDVGSAPKLINQPKNHKSKANSVQVPNKNMKSQNLFKKGSMQTQELGSSNKSSPFGSRKVHTKANRKDLSLKMKSMRKNTKKFEKDNERRSTTRDMGSNILKKLNLSKSSAHQNIFKTTMSQKNRKK